MVRYQRPHDRNTTMTFFRPSRPIKQNLTALSRSAWICTKHRISSLYTYISEEFQISHTCCSRKSKLYIHVDTTHTHTIYMYIISRGSKKKIYKVRHAKILKENTSKLVYTRVMRIIRVRVVKKINH